MTGSLVSSWSTAGVSVSVRESMVLRLRRIADSLGEARRLVGADRFADAVEKLRRPALRLEMLVSAAQK